MLIAAIVAWIHYAAIIVLAGALVGEWALFERAISIERARRLRQLDMIYGIADGVTLASGLVRLWTEKGLLYYLGNTGFWIKIFLFVAVAVASIYPTMVFAKWGPTLRAGTAPEIGAFQARFVALIIRIEIVALLFMPLFAALMARGYL